MFPRLVPAAITPLSAETIINAWFREPSRKFGSFNRKISGYFDAAETYTFTSLMRTTYAALFPLQRLSSRKHVILPRYSCPSFAHGILANKLTIRYVDQDPNTMSFDMKELARKMDKDVLAIIVPHFFGFAHPIDEICSLARKHGCVVIEGVDYSIGAEYKGKRLGTFGDIGILNFQEGKALPIGGGGLFVRDKKLIKHFFQFKDVYRPMSQSPIVRSFAFAYATRPSIYYFVRHLFSLIKRDIKKVSFEDTIRKTHLEYDFEFSPDKELQSLSIFQKSLGLEMLAQMPKFQSIRNKNAHFLKEELNGSKDIRLMQEEPGLDLPHFIRYPIFSKPKIRDMLIQKLYSNGIEASSMYTDHGMDIDEKEFPGAAQIYNTLITLPVHPYVTSRDLEKLVNIVRSS